MISMTPFSLQVEDLTNIGPDRAVEFFRRLLWAEASRTGVGKHLIHVPQCINASDGGIDAHIEDASPSTDEVIPRGSSGFQIKSSDLSPSESRKELHLHGDVKKSIKPEIKRVLDRSGTYVLVLFADLTGEKKEEIEQALKEELSALGYSMQKVRVYTANQISSFAENFPALVAWFNNDWNQCLPYTGWADNLDVKVPSVFVPDDQRIKYTEEIREKLRNPDGECPIYRITGLSGIGKTRFVFETLSPDDIKNRTIYVRADSFRDSTLYNLLQLNHNLSAIVVVDDCDLQVHDELVRSFSARGPRLALLTLSYDFANIPPPSLVYRLDPLDTAPMEEIIKKAAPGLPSNFIRRLADFADGYPRIAVLLAETYVAKPDSSEELLRISDDALMNRLVGGRTDVTSEYFGKTKKVLTGLSLFSKVGFEGDFSIESQWVAELVNVDWNDFKNIVQAQRRRGIIQGQYFIYVTPFMLRVHLLNEWWESHGLSKEDFEGFILSIPEAFRADLLHRFIENIPYIHATKKGRDFARAVLGERGIFSDGTALKTKLGADFFLKLTEADPDSALGCLLRTVGTWNRHELVEFTVGRREVVWALERIAVWRHLFMDAARLLLDLGEAENETCSNNASGVFAGLFSPMAATEASPQERFPILKEALESISPEKCALGLRACDYALESRHFVRSLGAEYQGLKKEPKLWKPQTYAELFDAYSQAWQLLRERLERYSDHEREEVVNILLRHARGLGRFTDLADMVIDTMNQLVQRRYVPRKKILATIIQILNYEGRELPPPTRHRWEQLKETLTGRDFSSLMRRYVGMDLLEDRFDEEGKRVDQTQSHIETLAEEVIGNKELLHAELNWLVTTEAQNGFRFGYELGKKDKGFLLLPILLAAQRSATQDPSAYFLSGYFRALFEGDRDGWENQLEDLLEDSRLNIWIPELTWRSGMSDQGALRVLRLAERKVIGIDQLRMFCFGSVVGQVSESVFKRWIGFLLSCQELSAVSIALDLYQFYYTRKESKQLLPEELTLKLLTHRLLFEKIQSGYRDQMDEYHWTEIGRAFVGKYPERSLELANKVLEHFGEEGTIVQGFHSQTQAVLNEIARRYPRDVWKLITKYLGPPIDSRAFCIKEWLRGGEFFDAGDGAILLFPTEEIWAWVDEDLENRAWYIASFVPNKFSREEGKICLAREVLVRYGDREDVRRNLMANFSTEGWVGPGSLHYERKVKALLDFKKDEENQNVRSWIDQYISSLEHSILRERIEEERRGL